MPQPRARRSLTLPVRARRTRRTLTGLLCLAILSLALAGPSHAAPGDLDPSFGENGKAAVVFETGSGGAFAAALQPDGKLITVGRVDGNFSVARTNPDGSLDTSFSGDGKDLTDFGGFDTALGVALDSQGRIVVVGVFNPDDPNAYLDWAVARLNPDGSLDTSFSDDGKLITQPPGPGAATANDTAYAVAVQPDDKIVVAGTDQGSGAGNQFGVARLLDDGSLDPSFGGDGFATADVVPGASFDFPYALSVQPDGKVLVGGRGASQMALTRFSAGGALDPSFSGDGIVLTGGGNEIRDIELQPDGKIVAAGGRSFFTVARYSEDGAPDPAFSGDGLFEFEFGPGFHTAYGLALQPDGRIVAAGKTPTPAGGNSDFGLIGLTADGALDPSFSGDGNVTTDMSGGDDTAFALIRQPDSKLVAAGDGGGDQFGNGGTMSLARYLIDGSGATQCSDADDNDGDQRNNYPADPGCDSVNDNSEAPDPACGDRISNDKDGLVDYRPEGGGDPGCDSDRDTSEYDTVSLTVDIDGPGSVGTCTKPCQKNYERGEVLTLLATPAEPNDGFINWSGCDSVSATSCFIRLEDARTVRASFDPVVSYAPWMSYHPAEKWWPMDPNQFIKNSALRWANIGNAHYRPCKKGIVKKKAWKRGSLDAAGLADGDYRYRYCYQKVLLGSRGEKQYKTYTSAQLTSPSVKKKRLGRSGFYLDINNNARKGDKPSGNQGPTIYVEYKRPPKHKRRSIIYWFFSGKNDVDWDPPGLPYIVKDLHEGDWEHIVIKLDENNQATDAAYYQHYCPGEKHSWTKMQRKGWLRGNSHPAVYVALGAHASNPEVPPDSVDRVACKEFGGLGDNYSRLGLKWETWKFLGADGFTEASTQPWYGFGGGWGHKDKSSDRKPGPFWGPVGPGRHKTDALPPGW